MLVLTCHATKSAQEFTVFSIGYSEPNLRHMRRGSNNGMPCFYKFERKEPSLDNELEFSLETANFCCLL